MVINMSCKNCAWNGNRDLLCKMIYELVSVLDGFYCKDYVTEQNPRTCGWCIHYRSGEGFNGICMAGDDPFDKDLFVTSMFCKDVCKDYSLNKKMYDEYMNHKEVD